MRRWMMLGLLYLVLRIRCTRIDQRTKLINWSRSLNQFNP
jgi:uncharacterized membrane protein YciS (DUF1049 family)